MAEPFAVVSRRGADRLRAGHPWIYRSDVIAVEAAPGDLVAVRTERRRRLGWALWSNTSQIALRSVGADLDPNDEAGWLRGRLEQALATRDTLDIQATAWRLVNAESDRLPGLIVDRYGDVGGATYLVLQTLVQGTDRRMPVLVELLTALVGPRGILARNDPRVRRLEHLEERVDVLAGEIPDEITVREGDLQMRVNLLTGQKTGLFLDQRENHRAAAAYARGRALDAFSYHGGFALAMATRATSVLALDSSPQAVAAVRANANLNGLENVEAREVNVFDELRDLELGGARFETIVLDPPAFARTKAVVERALAGYKEINLRALRLLEPGGHLMTCSCSYHVGESRLLAVVAEAAADVRATVALVEKRMQSRDHPVLVGVPETQYLTCLILRRVH